MEMFKCGHGTCKDCYRKMVSSGGCSNGFSCPLCRGDEQLHSIGFLTEETSKWTTFAEWYSEFEIYIQSGFAKNIVKNSTFGKQLLRLVRESRKSNSMTNSTMRK